jgi:Putative Flp pilus-assembly TadE/G-like
MRFPSRQLRQLVKTDEGQAMVLTALALVVLMMMAGMGVDVGYLRYQKMQMQKAADAGALAGASALIYGGDYGIAAKTDVYANGYLDGKDGILVTVNNPPLTPGDPFYNDRRYVEVIVKQDQPTFFMRVAGFTKIPVRSRAVASADGPASGCIFAMDPSAPHSFFAAGTLSLTASCAVYVESTSSDAYNDDMGACISSSAVGVVGGVENTQACSTTPHVGIPAFLDPLADLPAPTRTPCTLQSGTIIGGPPITLNPANFCGGISITGSANVTFKPGLYYLDGGGLTIGPNATVTGNGVTFFNSGGSSFLHQFRPVNISGGGTINLSAPTANDPTTGAMEGILIFEDRNPPASSIINNTIHATLGSTFDGVLYFKRTALSYQGDSSATGYTIIVANKVSFTGFSTLNHNFSSLIDGPPIKSAVLAE